MKASERFKARLRGDQDVKGKSRVRGIRPIVMPQEEEEGEEEQGGSMMDMTDEE
jgi:hypothetical protein